MSESTTHMMRAVSGTSPDGLLVPSKDPFDATHRRSGSLAPSFRSITTSIGEKDQPVEIGSFSRRSTFKIQRKPSAWTWIKALFDREGYLRELEDAIKFVPEHPPRMPGSQFIFDVLVSTKAEHTIYHNTRCLLDTGCLSGNLVSREFVESLGYETSDFQEPTPLESRGGNTLTGEHFYIEAAILLSWHHSASPVMYRRMRFLVVSSSKFEMIIGADAIARHGLLISPVFAATAGHSTHVKVEDPRVLDPNIEQKKWLSNVENHEYECQQENKKPAGVRDVAKIEEIESNLPWERHVLEVLTHRLNAAKARRRGNHPSAAREEDLAKKEVEMWNAEHDSSTSDAANVSNSSTHKAPVKRGSGHSK